MDASEPTRLIYIDTSVWNRLSQCANTSSAILDRLDQVNATVVVGDHAVHELAKTFRSSRPIATERAPRLCAYLAEYIDLGVPVIKQDWSLLIEETLHVNGDGEPPEIFLPDQYRPVLRGHLADLAAGRVSAQIESEMDHRTRASRDITSSLQVVLARETPLAEQLKSIEPSQLKQWLDAEMFGPIGVEALTINIHEQFPDNDRLEVSLLARRILNQPSYRVSRAKTRATLYALWRCANFGTLPRDFNDDLTHLMNASYCDFFATSDPQHARQRSEVFDTCSLLVCEHGHDVMERLVSGIRTLSSELSAGAQ